jgi:glyceraldehyde 3-phosphate dehydrogenase
MARVAINGFGRIGRGFMRAVQSRAGIEVVAVNDLTSPENLAYLLKYDSVYGRAPFSVSSAEKALVVAGKNIPVLSERDPVKLPWKDMNIDIVLESTGFFTDATKAHAHIDAGAKKVVISAPGKGEGFETILIGANEQKFGTCDITSNASCTTNAANPIIGVLDEAVGIERAVLSTAHAYTASQSLVDSPSGKDMKEGRAAALNIVPTSTGAASATALAYPQLKGKFDGISLRVPVPAGSMVDVTFVSKRATSVEEVNNALKAAAQTDKWKRVFAVTEEPLVSTDILGLPYGAIADLNMTRVVDGTLVKVLAWYDNEMGYVHTLVEHVASVAGKL